MAAPAAPPPPAPTTTTPPAPAAPETPMARVRANMGKTAVLADLSAPDPSKTVQRKSAAPTEPPKPPETPPKLPETPPATDDLEGEQTPTAPDTSLKTDDPPKPPEKLTDEKGKPIDPKKVSPWKLLDQFKGRLTVAEKENVELREKLSKVPNIERLESIEKRNQELEEEIKYHNYAKSEEFAKNYQKPYEEAWAKAISDLGELEVLAEDGTPARKAAASDLISLARLPLGEARKLANQMFGDSANDVMLHRQRIRDLSDAQNKALEDARKTGADRHKQLAESNTAIQSEITSLWTKFNSEDSGKYEFLKPKEGDDEWNSKLDKAKELVDGAFTQNATDPRLTPEQRAKLVRAHAAVRNRAIAYSPLKLENTRLKAQIKERDDKLKQFEDSAPTGGNGARGTAQPQSSTDPMEAAKQRLRQKVVVVPGGYL